MAAKLVEPDARADPPLLRRGSGRARLPRGRRPARARPLRRARRGRASSSRSATSASTPCRPGAGCGAFARDVARAAPRMLIGESSAVSELWDGGALAAARAARGPARASRSSSSASLREPGETGLRPATLDDFELLLPACAAAHEQELGVDPLRRDAEGFRWRTRSQIEEGRSWLWVEDGDDPVQGRGLGLDAVGGAAPAGLGRSGVAPTAATARAGSATSAACCSSASRPSASSSAPRTCPRSACTRRSAWSTCSTTARCCSDARGDAVPRPARARRLEPRRRDASCTPPGDGLDAGGRRAGAAAARRARGRARSTSASRPSFARTQETLELALAGRDVPRIVVPELNEIRFGSFDGGPLDDVPRVGGARAARRAGARAAARAGRDGAARFARGLRAAARAARGRRRSPSGTRSRSATSSTPRRGSSPRRAWRPVEHAVPHRLAAEVWPPRRACSSPGAAAPRFRGSR